MSELSLLLIHDDYVQAIASLKRIESGLDSMTNTKDSVADAVGHSGLAGAYRDFNEDWRAKRRKLTEAVQGLRHNFETSKDTFDRIDKEIAEAYNKSHKGDQGGGQDGGGQGGGQSPSPAPAAPGGGGGGGGGLEDPRTPGYTAPSPLASPGSGASLDDTTTGPTKDPSEVTGKGGSTSLDDTTTDEKLPKVVINGTRQVKLGHLEGVGTLMGEAGPPPKVTTVVTPDGTVCDIADLQPVYNDKGDLVSISQVKVPAGAVDLHKVDPGTGDADVARVQGRAGQANLHKTDPGTGDAGVAQVQGGAGQANLTETNKEYLDRVRRVLGSLVDVALDPAHGGETTLNVAGVSGIGLTALATLLGRRDTAPGAAGSGQGGEADPAEALRRSLAEGRKNGTGAAAGPVVAEDRASILQRLLGVDGADIGSDDADDDSDGAVPEIHDVKVQPADAGTPSSPVGAPGATGASGDAGAPGAAGDPLPSSPGSSDGGSSDPLTGSDPLTDPGPGSLTDPDLPVSGGVGAGPVDMPADTAAPTPPAAEDLAPDTTTAPSTASEPSGSTTGTRDAGMMSGMGLAAGMSALGARSGGANPGDEVRRNDEARRLRERLAAKKEKN
mgnify:CR=1 FL=1